MDAVDELVRCSTSPQPAVGLRVFAIVSACTHFLVLFPPVLLYVRMDGLLHFQHPHPKNCTPACLHHPGVARSCGPAYLLHYYMPHALQQLHLQQSIDTPCTTEHVINTIHHFPVRDF